MDDPAGNQVSGMEQEGGQKYGKGDLSDFFFFECRCDKLAYRAKTGLNPAEARPAAKEVPHSSAIPTSTKDLGYSFENGFSPVPSGIPAVMATIESSFLRSFKIALPNAFEKVMEVAFFKGVPSLRLKGCTPWKIDGDSSA